MASGAATASTGSMNAVDVPGDDHSSVFLGPVSVMYIIALFLSTLRVYSRASPELRLKCDDYTLVLAMLLASVYFIITAHLYRHGRGVDDYTPDRRIVGPWFLVSTVVWLWALNLIRISMGLMLLRLKEDRGWVWPLRALVILQVCLIMVAGTVQTLRCQPVSGSWDPTPGTECISHTGMMVYGYVYNVLNILSDVAVSLMPLTFIGKVRRTLLERVILCGLMAAGLGAAVAASVRVALLLQYYGNISGAWMNVESDLLASLEMFLGLMGANLPCLKGPAHRFLVRTGLLRISTSAGASLGSFLYRMTNGGHVGRQIWRLAQLGSKGRSQCDTQQSQRTNWTGGELERAESGEHGGF